MTNQLKSIVSRILKSEISTTDKLQDCPTWSSLNLMLIVMEIEDAFNLDLKDEILPKIAQCSISELEELIKK